MSKINYNDKQFLYQNADVPAKNKVNDVDMNEIKNAINQEGRYTLGTYVDGAFVYDFVGTLELGDIIQIMIPLNEGNASDNILLSADNGTTFYNLTDKNGNVLKIEDFSSDSGTLYIKAVYNESDFVLISPETQKNIMCSRIGSDITTTTNNGTATNLVEYNSVGKRIKIENGVIVIGKGVTKVNVSLTMTIKSETANAIGWQPYLKYKAKNDSDYSNIATARDICNASEYNTLAITNLLVNVSEGDKLTLGWYKGTSNSATIKSGTLSNFEVEEVR